MFISRLRCGEADRPQAPGAVREGKADQLAAAAVDGAQALGKALAAQRLPVAEPRRGGLVELGLRKGLIERGQGNQARGASRRRHGLERIERGGLLEAKAAGGGPAQRGKVGA